MAVNVEVCHIDDGTLQATLCGADETPMSVNEMCEDAEGAAICPTCGCPKCPQCIQIQDRE